MRLLTATLTALAVSSTGAMAQTIDQNQPLADAYMAGFHQFDLAQSFRPGASTIVGAGIFLQPGVGGTDWVNIALWTGLPNAGGIHLASAGATGTAGQWVDVFWSAVNVTVGDTYYLVFSGNTTLGIAGSTANPYADGQVYANPGYQPFPNYDYTFRTWTGEASAVPEPLSMLLLGTGLVGVAAIRRRRGGLEIA